MFTVCRQATPRLTQLNPVIENRRLFYFVIATICARPPLYADSLSTQAYGQR